MFSRFSRMRLLHSSRFSRIRLFHNSSSQLRHHHQQFSSRWYQQFSSRRQWYYDQQQVQQRLQKLHQDDQRLGRYLAGWQEMDDNCKGTSSA